MAEGPEASSPAAAPQVGDVLVGKYAIEKLIGEGGMCLVYLAKHLQLGVHVAVKLLRPEYTAEPDLVLRFTREGRAAIRIRSEHVVRVFDVDTLPNGDPYMVLEHLVGNDLDALLTQNGPIPYQAAIDYMLQAGEAIGEAHSLGIIHRDLKPANLFLTQRADGSPWVKVLDFGISKLIQPRRSQGAGITAASFVMGSPRYMSPEQMRSSRDVDIRTDIWSFGAVLYELISGRPPFDTESVPEVCALILKGAPTPLEKLRPDLPHGLVSIIHRCLEKDRELRYQDLGELAQALAEYATPAGAASAARIHGTVQSFDAPAGGGILTRTTGGTSGWGSTDPSWAPTRQRSNVAYVGIMAGAFALIGLGALGTVMALRSGAWQPPIATAAPAEKAPASPIVAFTAPPAPPSAGSTSLTSATLPSTPRSPDPQAATPPAPASPSSAPVSPSSAPVGKARPTVATTHRRRSTREPAPTADDASGMPPPFPPPIATAESTPVVATAAPPPSAPPVAASPAPQGGDTLFDERK